MVIGARMMFNDDKKASDIVEENKVENMQPPDMIRNVKDFHKCKERLLQWSRMCYLSPQVQFDVVMNSIDVSHPLHDRLEYEIGNSNEDDTHGVSVILKCWKKSTSKRNIYLLK